MAIAVAVATEATMELEQMGLGNLDDDSEVSLLLATAVNPMPPPVYLQPTCRSQIFPIVNRNSNSLCTIRGQGTQSLPATSFNQNDIISEDQPLLELH
ncbi:hypothetical protein AAY473_015287 [Plecturocebus cupreus]